MVVRSSSRWTVLTPKPRADPVRTEEGSSRVTTGRGPEESRPWGKSHRLSGRVGKDPSTSGGGLVRRGRVGVGHGRTR